MHEDAGQVQLDLEPNIDVGPVDGGAPPQSETPVGDLVQTTPLSIGQLLVPEQQQQAMIAALASQTLLKRLGSAFWDAFSGGSSPGNTSLSADKVRRVLEGKAVVKVVDVEDQKVARKEMGAMRRMTDVKNEPKDVCSLLEESMRSLTIGKK